jgi:hypothetical protein
MRCVVVMVVAMAFCGCADGDDPRNAAEQAGSSSPHRGTVELSGRLVDGETGKPVSRRRTYMQAFADGSRLPSAKLEPEDTPRFAFNLTGDDIRIEVWDKDGQYERLERTFKLGENSKDVELRLTPARRVLVHGRVLWRDAGKLRPPAEGDSSVRDAVVSIGGVSLVLSNDGSFAVRLPRKKLPVMTVNTRRDPIPEVIDLSTTDKSDMEQDIILEAH